MKTKFWKIFPLIISFLCFVSFITACSSGEDYTRTIPPGEKCLVTFDADNGSDVVVVEVISGEKVARPADPIKDGYKFGGWYRGIPTNNFNFNETINRNTTLKALWKSMFIYDFRGGVCSLAGVIDEAREYEHFIIPEEVEINGIKCPVSRATISFNDSHLKRITLPKTLKYFEYRAFIESKIEDVYYNGTIEDWCDIFFHDEASSPMYNAPNFYILDENGTVENNGKKYSLLNHSKELILPYGLTSIGDYSFFNWKNIESIAIPDSVTEIGTCAFLNCSGLKNIEMPNDIKSIGSGIFNGCTSLKFNEYGNSCYLGNEKNPYVALIKTTNLDIQEVEINAGCKAIAARSFFGCDKLIDLYYNGTVEDWCNITIGTDISDGANNPMFYASNFYLLDNNGSVKHSDKKYKLLTELVIPNTITKVGNNQFSGFNCLTSITIPNTITAIGNFSFCNCDGLKNITIPNSVTTIGSCAFFGCSGLTTITIPDSVTNVDTSAFSHCTNLLSIVVGKNVTEFHPSAINDCYKLLEIYNLSSLNNDTIWYGTVNTSLDAQSLTTTDEAGYIFAYFDDKGYLVGYVGNESELTLPSSFTYSGNIIDNYDIYKYAFYGNNNITNIKIPEGVTVVGENAFDGCSNLEKITMPKCVKEIGKDVFNECESLTDVYYNGTVEGWANITFDDQKFISPYQAINFYVLDGNEYSILADVTLPTTATIITREYLHNMTCMTSVTLPNTITNISDGGFYKCEKLTNVYYNGTLEDWCNIAINEADDSPMCRASNFYILDENGDVEHKGNKYSLLTELVIPSTITKIGNCQFTGFNNLEIVTIPDNVTRIGEMAFYYCINIKQITIADSVKSIASGAFFNCLSLPAITLPKNINTIESSTFVGCQSLTKITIPQGVTTIGSSAFFGCSSLESISIPDSVTTIGSAAFAECSKLTMIKIPNSVTKIGDSAFINSGLIAITIPSSVTSLEDNLFVGCKKLSSVTLPKTLTTIGYRTFGFCPNLKSIVLPGDITKIDDDAFYNCENLSIIYYEGTRDQCPISTHSSIYYKIYFYADQKPVYDADDSYQYWHYGSDGVTPQIWRK